MSIEVEQSAMPSPGSPGRGAETDEVLLDVQGMNKNFGGLMAVGDLDLKIYRRQIYSIIGPNGAGKTTVFNIITGIYRPNRRSIGFLREVYGYVAMLFIQIVLGIAVRHLIGLLVGATLGYFLGSAVNALVRTVESTGNVLVAVLVALVVALGIAGYIFFSHRRLGGHIRGLLIGLFEAAAVGFLCFLVLADTNAQLSLVAAVAVFLLLTAFTYSLFLRFTSPFVAPLLIQAENYFRPYQGKILLSGRELIGLSPDQILRQGVG